VGIDDMEAEVSNSTQEGQDLLMTGALIGAMLRNGLLRSDADREAYAKAKAVCLRLARERLGDEGYERFLIKSSGQKDAARAYFLKREITKY
jgi:hypothetical protein